MSKGTSKNSTRGKKENTKFISKWGGEILIKRVFKDGKMKTIAECQKTGNIARRPRDLM